LAPGLGLKHAGGRAVGGPAWAYTAWLLADFLDFAADENGATAKLTDGLFTRLLEEDADDEGRS
jgi:hypothetical protein